jgi:hypothetical protein
MDTDLVKHPPRRWSESLEGIIWLPRLIDKARAYDAGTLGTYLFGQSPTDASFLRAAGLDYAQVLEATRAASDDAGVLTEFERMAPGVTDRLRQWSENPPAIARSTFPLVDAEEGYAKGFARVLGIAKPFSALVVPIWRALAPLRVKSSA